MRITIIVLLLAGVASLARAVNSASEEAKGLIREQIVRANLIDSKITAVKTLRGAFRPGSPDYIRLDRDVRRVIDEQSAAYAKAVHMTIHAYGLRLAVDRGTSVMPATEGRSISWIPVVRTQEDREVQGIAGGRTRMPQSRVRISGRQYADGVTYIDPSTLREHSVGWLASTLLHERTHFEQMTTRGRGDTQSVAQLEQEAYQAEKTNEASFFDPLDSREKEEMLSIELSLAENKNLVAKEAAARKGLMGLVRRILPAAKPPNIFDSRVHTDAELESLKKQSDRFEAEAERMLAKAREDAELRRMLETVKRETERNRPAELRQTVPGRNPDGYFPVVPTRPDERGAVDELPGRPNASYDLIPQMMRKIGMNACSTPPRAFNSELSWIPWSEFRGLRDIRSQEAGLSACELRVFRRLVDFGRAWTPGATIIPDAIRAAVSETYSTPVGGGTVPPTQSHDPVWGKIGPIIGR